MLLHNYCQKTYCFAIERFHAMWKFRVEIDAVTLVQDDFLPSMLISIRPSMTRLNSCPLWWL